MRIAYLVDASGSLLDTLPQAVDWLNRAVSRLDGSTLFTVIFFCQGKAIEASPAGLKAASRDARPGRDLRFWMEPSEGNVGVHGRSEPLAALHLALGYEVDELFILSDDSFGIRLNGVDADPLLSRIDEVVADRRLRINTVQFFYEEPQGVLEAIARRHEGNYQFIAPQGPTGPDLIEAQSNVSAAP